MCVCELQSLGYLNDATAINEKSDGQKQTKIATIVLARELDYRNVKTRACPRRPLTQTARIAIPRGSGACCVSEWREIKHHLRSGGAMWCGERVLA